MVCHIIYTKEQGFFVRIDTKSNHRCKCHTSAVQMFYIITGFVSASVFKAVLKWILAGGGTRWPKQQREKTVRTIKRKVPM